MDAPRECPCRRLDSNHQCLATHFAKRQKPLRAVFPGVGYNATVIFQDWLPLAHALETADEVCNLAIAFNLGYMLSCRLLHLGQEWFPLVPRCLLRRFLPQKQMPTVRGNVQAFQ